MEPLGKTLQVIGLLATTYGIWVGVTGHEAEQQMLTFGLAGFLVFYVGVWFRGKGAS